MTTAKQTETGRHFLNSHVLRIIPDSFVATQVVQNNGELFNGHTSPLMTTIDYSVALSSGPWILHEVRQVGHFLSATGTVSLVNKETLATDATIISGGVGPVATSNTIAHTSFTVPRDGTFFLRYLSGGGGDQHAISAILLEKSL